jgi:hypothetical protein
MPEAAWGIVVPESHSVETLSFCWFADGNEVRRLSFPARIFVCWRWEKREPEIMTFWTVGEMVTVTGRGLKSLIEAMDQGRLQAVWHHAGESNEGPIAILSIRVDAPIPPFKAFP